MLHLFYMLIFSSLLELKQKKRKVGKTRSWIKGKENNNKGWVIKGLNTFLTIPNAYSLSV